MNILSKSNQKKFAGIILTSVLTFTYGTSVFAATTSNKSLETKYNVKIDYSKVTEALKVKLNNLVDAGMLTQTQADAVLKAMSQKGAVDPQEQKGSPLDSIVKTGTITKNQTNTSREAIKTAKDSNKSFEDVIDTLVDAGTLTQTQADAVLKAMSQKGAEDPQEQKGSPLDSLVKAETLTEDQANSIEDIYKTIIDSIINSSN